MISRAACTPDRTPLPVPTALTAVAVLVFLPRHDGEALSDLNARPMPKNGRSVT